jgi:hypothetical protein
MKLKDFQCSDKSVKNQLFDPVAPILNYNSFVNMMLR